MLWFLQGPLGFQQCLDLLGGWKRGCSGNDVFQWHLSVSGVSNACPAWQSCILSRRISQGLLSQLLPLPVHICHSTCLSWHSVTLKQLWVEDGEFWGAGGQFCQVRALARLFLHQERDLIKDNPVDSNRGNRRTWCRCGPAVSDGSGQAPQWCEQ